MTAEELYTQCPTCKTVYRTHERQLAVQAGKVRCGECRMVFDGRAHLIELPPEPDSEPNVQEEAGPPAATGHDASTVEPVTDSSPPPLTDSSPSPLEDSSAVPLADAPLPTEPPESTALPVAPPAPLSDPTSAAALAAEIAEAEQAVERMAVTISAATGAAPGAVPPIEEPLVLPTWQEAHAPPRPAVRWAYGVLGAILLLTLAAQVTYHFRHALAADYPALRPHLVAACAALGCSVDPLRNKEEINIESHDLQADPAHQGLLILQTTLRNQSRHPLAFPHLELELNDLAGQPIVRRVFAPVEYAGGAADFTNGIPSGAEWNVKLFLDASSISAGGYNLYLFYP